MLTERNKLALSGALALAMGLVIGVSLSGSDKPTRDATHEAIGSALASGSATGSATDSLNTGEYHRAIKEVRDADPTAIDILTPLVEPGATVTTGVNLRPRGSRTTATVEYLGPSASTWQTISVTHTDRDDTTWVEVTARNTGAKAARLVALVRIAP